jgi:hypothetical protein
MQTEQNTDLLYFDGYCPECNLKGKQQALRLNSNDFWECVTCHLQLTSFAPYAVILRWRGEGVFRQTEDFARKHYDKLILTGTSQEPGNNIFPDPRQVFYDRMDLAEYLESVYESEEAYHNDQFDTADPVLQRQEGYLETIATEEWVDLVELYKEVQREGLQSDSFHAFHQKLYEQKIIFAFKWQKWTEGMKALQDSNVDLSNSSLLQLSMYLTLIFRADRFNNGITQQCLRNGVLDKLIKRLEEIT